MVGIANTGGGIVCCVLLILMLVGGSGVGLVNRLGDKRLDCCVVSAAIAL